MVDVEWWVLCGGCCMVGVVWWVLNCECCMRVLNDGSCSAY